MFKSLPGYDTIISLDHLLFFLINRSFRTPLLDAFAMVLSGLGTYGFVWLGIGLILIFREEKREHSFIAPLAVAAGTSWIFSEFVIKNMFERNRPFGLPDALTVGPVPDGFSFPSTHASIAFALAAILARKEPSWAGLLYLSACLVGWSRIYLGSHYPIDVTAGAVFGLAIGHATWWAYRKVRLHPSSGPMITKRTAKRRRATPGI